jgi:hypothetical protein
MTRNSLLIMSSLILPIFLAISNSCTDMGKSFESQSSPNPSDTLTVWADVSPIFQVNCVVCHGGNGALYLDSYNHALTTGNHAPVVIAGDSNNSLLYQAVKGTATIIPRMPLGLAPLPAADIATIKKWIDDGTLEFAPSGK